jgi:hypothetical protein
MPQMWHHRRRSHRRVSSVWIRTDRSLRDCLRSNRSIRWTHGGCDLLPVVNDGASHTVGPVVRCSLRVYTPTGCWPGHSAVTPILQWGRGSALLTRRYLACFTSVTTRYGHRTRKSTVRRFTPGLKAGILSPKEDRCRVHSSIRPCSSRQRTAATLHMILRS